MTLIVIDASHYIILLSQDIAVSRRLDFSIFFSLDRGTPFEFELGARQVIRGWDQGLTEMCVGESRMLLIPAHLGYGDRGAGKNIYKS